VSRRKARRLAEADALSAEGYDAIDEVAARVAELVEQLETGAVAIDWDDTTSA
jgi:hypothetical protein